jgi:hypothetical protein
LPVALEAPQTLWIVNMLALVGGDMAHKMAPRITESLPKLVVRFLITFLLTGGHCICNPVSLTS